MPTATGTHRILVVDDEIKICKIETQWLAEAGYDCRMATSGKEALRLLSESPHFSLMICDIRMEEMNGLELLRLTKERFKDLAVIMLTGMDDPSTVEAVLDLGAYGYIVKPLERSGLLINVSNALRRRELEINYRTSQEDLERLVAERTRELKRTYEELLSSQQQIIQQEKLASIGQIAAGIAHEINNPTGFVTSNLSSLAKYVDRLHEFILAQSETTRLGDGTKAAELQTLRKKLKIDYILEDAKGLIRESLEGMARIKKIVMSLKTFSRKDQDLCSEVDINECLETTLDIVWNELKYKAVIEKDYGELQKTSCYPQQLSQVFMNILVNAAHAIEKQGVIRIKTRQEHGSIMVSIADNGCGIPEENIPQIFQAFFTTKEVGKGTGLGLSIVADIIKKHDGEITVESEPGKGSTFIVRIPVRQSQLPTVVDRHGR